MKIQTLMLSAFLVCNGQAIHADTLLKTRDKTTKTAKTAQSETSAEASRFLKKITPEMLYGYTDFDFSSVQGVNLNQFKGHSNLYSAGADHISLGSSLMAGIYYFRVDTDVNSKFILDPTPLTVSNQSIKNDTIFGHLLKIVTPQVYVDFSGGYGYNKINTFTSIAPLTTNQLVAQAHNNNSNWFLAVNGIYRKTWQKFLLRANLGVLYSQIDSGSYSYLFPVENTTLSVNPLTNKATLILENAELGYYINPKLMPFINGGLIQVASFSNSRPLLDASSVINGSLPQLNMDKNGFRLGGGISYTYKNVTLRIEEKYYNAGGTFHSNQALASLEYQFS